MIDGRILKFGSGDIMVNGGCYVMGRLCFRQIKPPQKVGAPVALDKVEYIGDPVVFENLEDISQIAENMRRVKACEILRFKCNQYTFDFSEGDPQSVDIVIKHVDRVLNQIIQIMAC